MSAKSICGVLQVDSKTATMSLTVVNGLSCPCTGQCACQNSLTAANTWINIRRDGPVYQHNSYGCCGNPAHRVEDCPILPGQLSYPYPTFIVPCPTSVAPQAMQPGVYYKYQPFVQYPLFQKKGNVLTFYFDSLFYNARSGRYVADLFINEVYCSSQKLNLVKGCNIASASTQRFNRNPCDDMTPAPNCATE